MERLLGKRLDHPVQPKQINGITSIRLNTPGGFGKEATTVVEQCANKGGWAVVYGHPHSLSGSNSQSESYLVPFFETVNRLRAEGKLTIGLPRDLLGN